MNSTVRFLTVLLTFSVAAFCEIIEVKNFSELLKYVEPESLVVLDIDDTLLLPTQTLGSDVWYCHIFKKYQAQMSKECALDKALADWEAVRHLTHVKIVEPGTDQIVAKLQDDKATVMALTTQGLALATRTFNQLLTLNIDMTKTAPSCQDHYFINKHGVLYRDGILFTSGTPKGPALAKLLELIGLQPKHVVFINDKAAHLKDLESGLAAKGIRFTGLRYGYGDERVANFRPEIADIQWNRSTFGHILSDSEAEALLKPN